jgi:hypothetical protein
MPMDPETGRSIEQLREAAAERPELAKTLFPEGLPASLDDASFANVVLERAAEAAQELPHAPMPLEVSLPPRGSPAAVATEPAGRRSRSMYRAYSRLVRESVGYWAVWPVGLAVDLGDVGVLTEDGMLQLVGNVLNYFENEPFERTTQPSAEMRLASNGVSISLSIQPDDPSSSASRSARIHIDMGGGATSLVQLSGTTVSRVADLDRLAELMKQLNAKGNWERDLVFVTEVVRAEKGVVLVAGADSASVDFDVRLSPEALSSEVEATSLLYDASLAQVGSTGTVATFIAQERFSPFYKCHRLRRSFFRSFIELIPA